MIRADPAQAEPREGENRVTGAGPGKREGEGPRTDPVCRPSEDLAPSCPFQNYEFYLQISKGTTIVLCFIHYLSQSLNPTER